MAYKIQKVNDGGLEYLPDIVDTPIWADYDSFNPPLRIRQIAALYSAVAARDNYFQFNTPTAFGNPDFSFAQGVVFGILKSAEIDEKTKNGKHIFLKGNKTILVVDVVQRPESYYAMQRENRETLAAFGF